MNSNHHASPGVMVSFKEMTTIEVMKTSEDREKYCCSKPRITIVTMNHSCYTLIDRLVFYY